ncbi:MAG: transglutaminase-like domain-containing protein [Syntrophaceae bacterium]|nr:transglutaminase-like domain-containing protein [Syntrophaceae bacterium]
MMIKTSLTFLILFLLAVSSSSCVFRLVNEDTSKVEDLQGYGELTKFTFNEAWYGIYFQEDKVGYSHFRIEPSGQDFIIYSDSLMRLTALKKTNEIKMNEKVLVRPDLTLLSFESSVIMNEKNLKVIGTNKNASLSIEMSTAGEKIERTYPVEGALYHSSAISLMPALKGLHQDAKNSFVVFNPEKQQMEDVEQLVNKVSGNPGPNDAVWKVQNKFGSTVVNSWLNRKGLTVLEKALDGSLITVLEDETLAKEFLNRKTQQKDLILDLSLVKSPQIIKCPHSAKKLTALLSGVDPALFPQDHRQQVKVSHEVSPIKKFELTVSTENLDAYRELAKKLPSDSNIVNVLPHGFTDELSSTLSIQSDHPLIVQRANSIVTGSEQDLEKIIQLVNWTSDNIRKTMRDSFSALEVLQVMEGECQSHASLYAAMARALKIPTRIVTGLVYTEGLGFLYHAWAESYVGNWLSVDPTLKQTPSDGTHIKIGHPSDVNQSENLLKMVGKLKIESIDYH